MAFTNSTVANLKILLFKVSSESTHFISVGIKFQITGP